ncbi:hypothetical protein JQ612_13500 [Bradyrhizobium manausense]|uniref:hypothetical protein n=1 Tax=Bradyrhizobium manausense TaxID=989370 RepID=UPI001BAE43FF|nr:hypothetical protein [Bradyrhizobium manausense]MBR0725549.1 hypothetical protein [Bradyrhizobium manausense]MBR0834209.1 hypothetical protein [Bradyrhizobium manausense]
MNAPEAVAKLKTALDAGGVEYSGQALPLRGSEDFGRFDHRSKAAMFFLGAGTDHAGLDDPNHDFPDELIDAGSRVFMSTLRNLLGKNTCNLEGKSSGAPSTTQSPP